MKVILKFILVVAVTTIAFILVSALLPYSPGFRTENENADPSILVYVLLINLYICLTIFYVIRHSPWANFKLMLGLTATLFFVYSFMGQLETFFFRSAFTVLTNQDILLITLANGTIVFVAVPLSVNLFRKEKGIFAERQQNVSQSQSGLIVKLLIIGITYVIIYFVFGYFVAWQTEELRIFYSGSPEDNGFISSMANNYKENPIIFPFQFLRGVLFGIFVLPLVSMFSGRSKQLLISLVLIFLSPGLVLMIPNFLFPDPVRWAHFTEMMSSMLVFSIIIWWVYDRLKLPSKITAA